MCNYEKNCYSIVDACANGHVFIYSGVTTGKIPEGTPCQCGATIASWRVCECCGQYQLVPILIRKDYKDE